MTQINKEKLLNKYPLPVTIDETEIILKQMKYSICKIENKIGNGTGFFCKISNKKLLITNNHIINEDIIKNKKILKVKLNDNKIKKDIKIIDYYTSEKYDTTIIEIEDENVNYLEIDDDIFDDNIDIYNKSIYIIQYPKSINEQKAAVSYGILNEMEDEYNIIHYCSTDYGSSGSPILKLSNKKIIGIHKEGISKYNYNRGTLLKYPIYEYLNKINKKFEKKNNEIKVIIKIEKKDINKDIYFLDNTEGNYDDGKHYHNNLKVLNELNTEIFINNKKYKYAKSFKPKKEGFYEIKIKFYIKIKDCSYMFYKCSNLTKIDLSSFNTKNVINMSKMFYCCNNLENINLSSFDTKNVTNMSNMFSFCSYLKNINLSFFDTKNVTNMSNMFYYCSDLMNIDLSYFDTNKVTNMSNMFSGCYNLTSIDLSYFDTKNVTDMREMFSGCYNLKNLDLSSFFTKNAIHIKSMFWNCRNLKKVIINNISTNIIEELRNIDANIIDQFGNNISKHNYLNNNNYLDNHFIVSSINNFSFSNDNMNSYNMINNMSINMNNSLNNQYKKLDNLDYLDLTNFSFKDININIKQNSNINNDNNNYKGNIYNNATYANNLNDERMISTDKENNNFFYYNDYNPIINNILTKNKKHISFNLNNNIYIKFRNGDLITESLITNQNDEIYHQKEKDMNLYQKELKMVKPKPIIKTFLAKDIKINHEYTLFENLSESQILSDLYDDFQGDKSLEKFLPDLYEVFKEYDVKSVENFKIDFYDDFKENDIKPLRKSLVKSVDKIEH